MFNAIVCLNEKVMVFPELCHDCGACFLVCPEKAITEMPHVIGITEEGLTGNLWFVEGRLNIGEASSPPVIRAVKQAAPQADLLVYDAPPGTTCPMVEAVRGSDFVVLVTESTPFGLHDLKLALEVIKVFKLDCGVVINRALPGRGEARELCQQARIPILVEIPDIIDVAEAGSRGELIIDTVLGVRRLFDQLLTRILTTARPESKSPALQSYWRKAVKAAAETGVEGCNMEEHQHKACFLTLRKREAKQVFKEENRQQ